MTSTAEAMKPATEGEAELVPPAPARLPGDAAEPAPHAAAAATDAAVIPASGEFTASTHAAAGAGELPPPRPVSKSTQLFDGPFSAPAPVIQSAEPPPARPSSSKIEAAPSSRALTSFGAERLVGLDIDERYVLEEFLGEGGMGIVMRGRHKVIGKRVAVKVLRADLAGDAELTERFLTEAKAASAVGHTNIVEIYDYGKLADGSAYFVMEYLEGVSLAKVLEDNPVVPLARALHIGRQVAEALHAAHEAGVVHRDMKPENVMLIRKDGHDDHVKILDFGIAKIATATNRLTRAGSVFGTPQYMSPEQANGDPVDHRTDIYALGCMLFEMVMGRVPFNADNVMAILSMQMFQPPPKMQDGPQPVPEAFENLVARALAKKADERYANLRLLADDLQALERGEAVSIAAPTFSARSLEDDPPRPPPASKLPIVLAAGLLVLGGGAFFALRSKPTPAAAPIVVVAPEKAEQGPQPITVSVLPKSAKVTFDGADVPLKDGTAKVQLAPGKGGKLRVEAQGYVAVDRDVGAADGPVLSFVLDKTPVDVAALPVDRRPAAAPVGGSAPAATAKLPTLPPPGETPKKPKAKDDDDPWK